MGQKNEKEQGVTNYARFWTVFNRIRYSGDREELKREMVRNATLGRTESLREVTQAEYRTLCEGLERMWPGQETLERPGGQASWWERREDLRKKRSVCLRLMQKMSVDTTNWDRVNALCLDGRIAGKEFRRLSVEELEALGRKLRSIMAKGGLRRMDGEPGLAPVVKMG